MRKSFLLLWGGVIVLLLFFWIYFPTLSRYRELKIQQEEMERQLKDLDKKIKELAEERHLLKHDPQYLEKVIRDELGLVKPGEVVYKLVPETPVPTVTASLDQDLSKAAAVSQPQETH